MTTLRTTLLLAFLALFSTPGFALMEIAEVTKDSAKEMGLIIRVEPSGPEALQFVLEFEPKGLLKDFMRADLEYRDGGKFLVASSLHEDRSKNGRIIVTFFAQRASLDKVHLRLVSGVGRSMAGYDMRVKDFVDLNALR
jgi:hypothetical protein